MADVARIAGVSKMTVSRALSGRAVSPETRARILAAVDAVHYVHDAAAGVLSSGRSGFVAALVPTLANSNFADTVRGLSDGLADAGLQVLLGYTDYRLDREEMLVRAMLRHRPEAVVLTGGEHLPATRAVLARARALVAETWDLPAHPLGLVAGFSNAAAAGRMVRHLADRGYRRIGFIGGRLGVDYRAMQRYRGLDRVLAEAGLSRRPPFTHEGRSSPATGGERLMATLAEAPELDALFFANDDLAIGALLRAQREGLAVPGRIAIAGFNGLGIGALTSPALTSIVSPRAEIGRLAAAKLLARAMGLPAGPARVDVGYSLEIREST